MDEIILRAFNADWHNKFVKEKILLANALGNAVFDIHHIGSTPIPDLLAKPIIDISIEAFDFPPSERTIEKLFYLGYTNNFEETNVGRFQCS